jgi:hypothetical protein
MTHPLHDLLGPEAFQLLVAWRGGCRIYIPRSQEKLASFEEVLGEQAARRLFEEACGCAVNVPRPGWSRRVSTVRVEGKTRRGMTAAEIARELGCGERAVYQHGRRAKAA